MSMGPEEHDKLIARISHLPQIVSIALVLSLTTANGGDSKSKALRLAGGGFKDMTRIAESPFDMWNDIFATNREFINEEVNSIIEILENLNDQVGTEEMEQLFNRASTLRSQIPRGCKGLTTSLIRIATMVSDEPGALATVTGLLAEAGINIKDIELQKVREDFGGTFHLYFSDRSSANEATEILNSEGFSTRVVTDS